MRLRGSSAFKAQKLPSWRVRLSRRRQESCKSCVHAGSARPGAHAKGVHERTAASTGCMPMALIMPVACTTGSKRSSKQHQDRGHGLEKRPRPSATLRAPTACSCDNQPPPEATVSANQRRPPHFGPPAAERKPSHDALSCHCTAMYVDQRPVGCQPHHVGVAIVHCSAL